MNKRLIIALIALSLLVIALYQRESLGAPSVFISTISTSSPAGDFGFTIATTTPLSAFGSSTLAIYGSTTIQTPVNTHQAFIIRNAATSTVFQVSTINASSTFFGAVNLGALTVTSCVGCGAGGAGFGNTWQLSSDINAITPTTTVGIIVNYGTSTIHSLSMYRSTTTFATSTYLSVENLAAYNSIRFGGSATSSFSAAGALTLITPLTVPNGGTGLTTFTDAGRIVYSSAATTLTTLAAGASSTVLTIDASGVPVWTPSPAFTTIRITAGTSTFVGWSGTGITASGFLDLSGAATLLVPVAASSTITTSGGLEIDTTDTAIHFNSGGTTRNLPALKIFGFTLASTTASESWAIPFTSDHAFTVSEVKFKMFCMASTTSTGLCGGGYDFQLTHGANQNSTSTLFGGMQNTTSTSTYTSTSTFSDASVAVDEEWFFYTRAASSSLHSIIVQVFGYFNP